MGKASRKATVIVPTKASSLKTTSKQLLGDIRTLIESARSQVAQAVNAGLVLLYWDIGNCIRRDILQQQCAEYGEEIVPTVSAQLLPEFGNGFSARNLLRMIRMAEVFPDLDVVRTLSAQLGWSHFVEIIGLKDNLQRNFYTELCRIEKWSVRTLRAKIGGACSTNVLHCRKNPPF